VATALQTGLHPELSFSSAILAAVVVEGDRSIHGFLNYPDRGFLIGRITKMMAPEPQNRDLGVGSAELPRKILPLEVCCIPSLRSLSLKALEERLTGSLENLGCRQTEAR
jgi:hypothetical protein